jgi:spore maturation protein CgeB
MKGAIIANKPYHNNPCCNLTNKELAKKMDKVLFYNDVNLNEKVDNLKDIDYIIALFSGELPNIKSLSRLGIPVILAAGDLPKRLRDNLFNKIVKLHKPNGIMIENICTIPAFKDYLINGEELDYLYYPWGIDEDVINDYGEDKKYDVAQLGQFNVYQHRREIYYLLNNNNFGIEYIRFWPRRNKITKKEEQPYDIYCKTLNQSLMSIGGCIQHKDYSHFKDTFMGLNFPKNMEIPGLNSILLNTEWGDMKLLGFKNGENFIQFKTPRHCIRQILKYKEEPEEIRRISKNGFKLVHERHTNKVHVDNLLKEIYRIYH